MKKTALISVALLLGLGLMVKGGDLVVVPLSLSNVTTTSTNDTVDATVKITGKIHAMYFTITSGGTCTVSVASSTTDTAFPETTYITKTGFTTDAWYYPRAGEVDTAASAITDSSARMPIISSYLQLRAKSANAVSNDVTAKIIVEK